MLGKIQRYRLLRIASSLFVNLAAGWFLAIIVAPNQLTLINDIASGILCLWFTYVIDGWLEEYD